MRRSTGGDDTNDTPHSEDTEVLRATRSIKRMSYPRKDRKEMGRNRTHNGLLVFRKPSDEIGSSRPLFPCWYLPSLVTFIRISAPTCFRGLCSTCSWLERWWWAKSYSRTRDQLDSNPSPNHPTFLIISAIKSWPRSSASAHPFQVTSGKVRSLGDPSRLRLWPCAPPSPFQLAIILSLSDHGSLADGVVQILAACPAN